MKQEATFDPSAACGGSSPSEGALYACTHPAYTQENRPAGYRAANAIQLPNAKSRIVCGHSPPPPSGEAVVGGGEEFFGGGAGGEVFGLFQLRVGG